MWSCGARKAKSANLELRYARRMEARLDRSLQRRYRSLGNQRLANCLLRVRDPLFAYLSRPDLEGTNWGAEQAIHPMAVARNGRKQTTQELTPEAASSALCKRAASNSARCSPLRQKLICSPQPRILAPYHSWPLNNCT